MGTDQLRKHDPGEQADHGPRRRGRRSIRTAAQGHYYRHFAWLTALRFFLREPKAWENTFEPGNAKYLAALPTPESQSALKDEIVKYLSDTEAQAVLAYRGDKEGLFLRAQYRAAGELKQNALVDDNVFVALIAAIDDLVRLQGSVKRIKSYPYARNDDSIALILVAAFVAIVPFGLFPYAHDLGKSTGTEFWTAWLNIPFAVFVGWIFVTLEKVGENSSNPFEGGPNDGRSRSCRGGSDRDAPHARRTDRPQADRAEIQHPVLSTSPPQKKRRPCRPPFLIL